VPEKRTFYGWCFKSKGHYIFKCWRLGSCLPHAIKISGYAPWRTLVKCSFNSVMNNNTGSECLCQLSCCQLTQNVELQYSFNHSSPIGDFNNLSGFSMETTNRRAKVPLCNTLLVLRGSVE